MRKASGRPRAVCEASPSINEQLLTFVPRAPSRFLTTLILRQLWLIFIRYVQNGYLFQ